VSALVTINTKRNESTHFVVLATLHPLHFQRGVSYVDPRRELEARELTGKEDHRIEIVRRFFRRKAEEDEDEDALDVTISYKPYQ